MGFLLVFYRITFVGQDFPSPLTCLHLPRLAYSRMATATTAKEAGRGKSAATGDSRQGYLSQGT